MAKPTITIIGLGVIGTSLGLALKKAGGNFELVGHDREPSASGKAKKLQAVDRTSWNLINSIEGADLVVLAIPSSAVEGSLKAMAQDLKPGCLVIDTCAVKRPILEWADALLPESVSFVGGHPIVQPAAANANGDQETASATLFEKAVFCLCPSAKASPEAVQLAADVVAAVGAKPYFLDAVEHDGLVAGVEHLPLLLSAALMGIVGRSPAWREMRKVAGATFQRMTESLAGDPAGMRSTILTNKDNMLRWIDETTEQLRELRGQIVDGDEEHLETLFDSGIDKRVNWLHDRAGGFAGEDMPPPAEAPSYWKTMFGMGGGLFRRRAEEQEAKKGDKRKR